MFQRFVFSHNVGDPLGAVPRLDRPALVRALTRGSKGFCLAGKAENLRLGDMPLFIQGVEPVVLERRHLLTLAVLSIF